eukprot:m.126750 g.126750  ORF g.126750 m.126750 type:complete len:329 (-) comp23513_c0_seq2:343-1329(-)
MPARPRGIRAASVPKAALRGITTQYEELPAPLAKIQILAAPPQAFRPTSGVFDLFFFLCLLVVLLVQNFNLNLWHLYKYNLVYIQFAAYLFLTQFVWRSSLPLLASSKRHSLETFFHVFLLGVMGALLLWSIRSLILEEQLSYLPYVFYPLVLSFCLFGLNLDPAKNWSVIGMAATEPDLVTVSFKYTACGVLYSSLEACYYTVLLPIWFRKEKDPQFNRVYSFLLLIVALVNTFVLLASYVCLTRGPVCMCGFMLLFLKIHVSGLSHFITESIPQPKPHLHPQSHLDLFRSSTGKQKPWGVGQDTTCVVLQAQPSGPGPRHGIKEAS